MVPSSKKFPTANLSTIQIESKKLLTKFILHKQRQIRYYEQYLWVSSLDTPVSFPFRFLWSFKNMAEGRLSNNMAKGRKLYKFQFSRSCAHFLSANNVAKNYIKT